MEYINLFYYNNKPNFGDRLITDICKDIFNLQTAHTSAKECEAAFIGSILECFLTTQTDHPLCFTKYFKTGVKIWGPGFIKSADFEESKNNLIRKIEVFALRGSLTKKRLEKILGKKLDVPLGDPGLLASMLIDTKKIKKEYELGIIPHYIEFEEPVYHQIHENIPNSLLIDIQDTPAVVLKNIAKCKAVISSAMHGLIAADSLAIPNMRVFASDKITGGDYKFDDYYSAFGLTSHKKMDLRTSNFSQSDIEKIYNSYLINYNAVEDIKEKLIKSFPYKKV